MEEQFRIMLSEALVKNGRLEQEIERLNSIIKTKDEGIKALTEDLCDTTKELEEGYERIFLSRNGEFGL